MHRFLFAYWNSIDCPVNHNRIPPTMFRHRTCVINEMHFNSDRLDDIRGVIIRILIIDRNLYRMIRRVQERVLCIVKSAATMLGKRVQWCDCYCRLFIISIKLWKFRSDSCATKTLRSSRILLVWSIYSIIMSITQFFNLHIMPTISMQPLLV